MIGKNQIEVKRGGLGLEKYWFYRFRGDLPEGLHEGMWSEERFRTRAAAAAAAEEVRKDWNSGDFDLRRAVEQAD